AGASYFGVSDCSALARETHKFESRYLDGLIGPWPQAEAVYHARSPLFHVDQLQTPVLFLQGLDDHIVLPNQAEMMIEALKKKGLPVAYVTFAGEGHGFRQAEHIKAAQQAEQYFYTQVFHLQPAESLPTIPISNLKH
ncbi:MAG: prolyl oligopeptidase family serine peptidase, partial [Firmicutes bacterium]|nr:prolyl oligopeptidase family serine peptidase [Bacillota bacterium]